MSTFEICLLQSTLNSLKREKENMDYQFDLRRQNILRQIREAKSSDTADKLLHELGIFNDEKRRETDKINKKIEDATAELSRKLTRY
jgi:hypothetical protein